MKIINAQGKWPNDHKYIIEDKARAILSPVDLYTLIKIHEIIARQFPNSPLLYCKTCNHHNLIDPNMIINEAL